VHRTVEAATRLRRRLVASLVLATLVSFGVPTAHAAVSPARLYRGLLKAAPAAALPPALQGSKTHSATLSAGSRSHRAVGAVEIGNSQALVGYLVFPTHALALADLNAFPPGTGPNKIVSNRPAGLPRPAYLIHANGNGYEVEYVVFIVDNVLVNSWAYGAKGSEKKLVAIVERDARWANSHVRQVRRSA
jgi:hypothetical protein